jgi:hypothetical protein
MSNKGMWARASEIAAQTPEDRNRYVDLLRALSISAVVLGHWIMAAPFVDNGVTKLHHLLDVQAMSHWLTWVFQVMPIFFFVGGFSNGVSWDGAQKKQLPYSSWIEARMRRLLGPVVPLVVLWIALGMLGSVTGIPTENIRIGSQIALVPVWFLAIYFIIVLLVPLTRRAWYRFGMLSIFVPILLAVVGDYFFMNTSMQWFGWFNYLFVWGAVHQLGYAWQQGHLSGALKLFILGVCSLGILIAFTVYGPYPISLVGVPSQDFSNTTPPKLPLLALGLTQIGFLLAIEGPVRRWLAHGRVWTATVLLNGLIMPIFLWHSTVMMLVLGCVIWLFPDLLFAQPGTGLWWSLRPIWILSFLAILLTVLPLFLRLEKTLTAVIRYDASTLRLFLAALLMCGGLAVLAGPGITGNGAFGLNWYFCLMPVVGGFIALFRTPKFFRK